jgi:hypothetical protein
VIIEIRGTSGSGKTTALREVMKHYTKWQPFFVPDRKRPLYYTKQPNLVVLGHYEIACGGCDTIGSVPQVFDVITQVRKREPKSHILGEGLLLSEDVKWVLSKPEEDWKILFLTTDPEECLKRVCQRQEEKGRPPADPERVRRKLMTRVGTIERARLRLVAAGIECRRCSSSQAPEIVLKWLKTS